MQVISPYHLFLASRGEQSVHVHQGLPLVKIVNNGHVLMLKLLQRFQQTTQIHGNLKLQSEASLIFMKILNLFQEIGMLFGPYSPQFLSSHNFEQN